MKGYVKAARLFFDAVLAQKDGKPPAGPVYDEVVKITARYTGATPEVVRVGFPYQDRDGRLDVTDIGRQLLWYHKAGMVTAPLQARDLVDALVPRGGATRTPPVTAARRSAGGRSGRRSWAGAARALARPAR